MRRFTFTRDFYIPKGAVKVADKQSDAVAYIYTTPTNKPGAVVFFGKQNNPVINVWYRDVAQRDADIARAFANRKAHAARVAESRATPSSTAVRNKAIKAALSAEFGQGKVTVRGHTGTAYGWLTIKIDIAPRHMEHRRELRDKVWAILDKAGLAKQIGSYDTADYGSGRKVHIDFLPVQDEDPLAAHKERYQQN